jgi:hypothetical protein
MRRIVTVAAVVAASATLMLGASSLCAQDVRDWGHSGGSYRGGGHHHHHDHHHGGGGRHYHSSSFFVLPPYGYGYSGYDPFDYGPYGYPYGGGGYSFPFAPPVYYYQPGGVQPFVENAPPLQEWLDEADARWNAPLDDLPVEELPRRYIKPSSTEAQLRAIRLQHEGDLQLRNLQFTMAVRRYSDAIATAPDVTDPYFHLAIAETGRGNYREALLQLKYGLQLNPKWPSSGETLDQLLGEDNLLAKTQIKQRVLDWVQEDIRDPDRLFLMGALLHIDNDVERGAVLLETAARLGGMKDYLATFLDADAPQAVAPQGADVVVPPPPPAPDEPADAGPAAAVPRAAEPVLPPPPVLN